MAEKTYLVGFDLGGTKMLAGVFTSQFKLVATSKKKTKAQGGAEEGVRRMEEAIREALEEAKVPPESVAAIGVGSPGPLDLNEGIVLESPNLGWRNVPLRKLLEKSFGCPAVIANDVDTGTYGEYRFGAARKSRCVVGVFPGTGIGGACVYEGRILRGKTTSCMEIGHMKVRADGELCGCGGHGCLETVASRLMVSAQVAAAAYRGSAPTVLAEAGTDLGAIRSSLLARSIEAGDKAVKDIVRRSARWIGFALANAVNLLGPDLVLLGGGLVEAMPELYLKEIREAVLENTMEALAKDLQFAVAELGDNATVMGAAALADDALKARAK
jgi:glucokinase